MEQQIIDSYRNDGFIYCISYGDGSNIKIGKMQNNICDTLEDSETKLLTRYSTYYPDCKIIKCVRVGNYHNAEREIFNLLREIHYKKEHYFNNKNLINDAFTIIMNKYPDVNQLLLKCNPIEMTRINDYLRIH